MNISLITCSRNPTLPQSLIKNIEDTIFLSPNDKDYSYEIITIDNSNKNYNIFQAYNEGVRQSSGEILCFMHDDVEYHSLGWGKTIIEFFRHNTKTSACAVAGCQYIKKSPSYYTSGEGYNKLHFSILKKDGTTYSFNDYCEYDNPASIVAFDGFWFCIKHECFQTIRFDDTYFYGFHLYDMDISMQLVLSGYHISTIPSIDIIHKGHQSFDNDFWQSAFLFYDKYHKCLPIAAEGINVGQEKKRLIETRALYSALRNIIRQHNFRLLWKWFSVASEVLGRNKLLVTLEVLSSHFSQSH